MIWDLDTYSDNGGTACVDGGELFTTAPISFGDAVICEDAVWCVVDGAIRRVKDGEVRVWRVVQWVRCNPDDWRALATAWKDDAAEALAIQQIKDREMYLQILGAGCDTRAGSAIIAERIAAHTAATA